MNARRHAPIVFTVSIAAAVAACASSDIAMPMAASESSAHETSSGAMTEASSSSGHETASGSMTASDLDANGD